MRMTSNELLEQLKSNLAVTSFVFIDNTEFLSQILVSRAPNEAIEVFYNIRKFVNGELNMRKS